MLSKKEKIIKILQTIVEKDISAYKVSKDTGLNESGVKRFLKGDVTNPQTKTVDTIYDYLYSNNTVNGIYLEKDGVSFSEEEILIWFHKNLERLKENSSLYDLVFKDMVNEKTKETIEAAGFKVNYTKKED